MRGDIGEGGRIGLRDHRPDNAIFDGHRNADIHGRIQLDVFAGPTRVHFGMLRQNLCDQRHEKIRVGQLDAL
jgi:hypothetical protein